MMDVGDRIIYPSRASANDAYQGLRRILNRDPPQIVGDFLIHLEQACKEGAIDFSFAAAHTGNETAWFTDTDFTVHRNPAGIGHPDNAVQGVEFESFRAAARFYVGELLLKLRKPIPSSLSDARSYAPEKWDQVERIVGGALGPFPVVETIADLNKRFGPIGSNGLPRESVWMSDPGGPQAIVDKGNRLFANLPDQQETQPVADTITFGKVPKPDITDRTIPSTVNTAWSSLGKRTVRGIVWHRSIGSHQGNDSYFRGEGRARALTDYGIGVMAQDGAALAGSIYQWNDPEGTRSPWANGPLSAPYGDGLAFFNRYGVEGVNRDLTSVEISGFQNTPLDEKSRQAIAHLTAYWADQAKMPWDVFPIVPGEARSFVLWHTELTAGTGKQCPFDVVKAETNSLIERARAILKKYQTSSDAPTPKPPTYADPIIPSWMATDLERGYPSDHVVDGVAYFAALRPYEAIREANRLQMPDIKAAKVGPRLKVREKFIAHYIAKTKDGRVFVLTPFGTFIDIKALTPRVTVRAA